MIINQLKQKEGFTNSEQAIADFVLKFPNGIIGMTASQLGESSMTSKASVLRLCKKLGLSGYNEFLRLIEFETHEQSRLLALLDDEPINNKTPIKELMDLVPTIYTQAIFSTKLALNPTIVQRVVNRIKMADRIDLYGVGIVESAVDMAVFKFQALGLNAHKQTNINEHAIVVTKENQRIVSILLSFIGKNEMILAAANYLKSNGIFTVGIGSLDNLDLKEICHEYLPITVDSHILTMEALAPYSATTYILDLLYAGLVIADYNQQVAFAKQVIEKDRYQS